MAENEIPGEYQVQWAAATAAEDRFFDQNDVKALQQALDIWQELVQSGLPSAPESFRWRVFDKLGLALFNLSRAENDPAHLARAISIWEDVLTNVSVEPPVRQTVLLNLGISVRTRFEVSGALRALDSAIAVSKQAVAAMPEGYPYRASALNTLGNDLRQRYERTRELGDLLAAIDRYGEAVELAQADPQERAMYLSNRGVAYTDLFNAAHAAADLDQALRDHKRAVSQTLATDPDLPSRRAYLANSLSARY